MAKHGWIEERTGNRGISFRVRYWAPNAAGDLVPRSQSFPARKHGGARKAEDAAKTFLAKIMTEVRAGTFVVPVEMTLRALVDQWIAMREGELKPSSLRLYESALRHLSAELAAMPIQRIKPMHIQKLYRDLRNAGVGASILGKLHLVLNAALKQAVAWELLSRNPAAAARPASETTPPIKHWTPEQSARFILATADDPIWGVAWRVAILTGMRMGELFTLTWDDVDLARGTITIARTFTRERDGRFVIGTSPKTKNSRRAIPIPPSCMDPLRRHRTAQRERRLQSHGQWDITANLVFDRGLGRPAVHPSYQRAFKRAVTAATLPLITPHGMRHGFATAMLLRNVHPSTVAELLGDTVETVLRVYSHVTVGLKSEAISELDTLIMSNTIPDAAVANATT